MLIFSVIRLGYRVVRFIRRRIRRWVGQQLTRWRFYVNGATIGPGLKSYGIPIVDINEGCRLTIGHSLMLNNGMNHNRIGRQQPCLFIADLGGTIRIGDRVGMSGTALVCHQAIVIGNDVSIGGNTVIYDTDFHSLDARQRGTSADNALANTAPVHIGNQVFIGAHVTILKGVRIGDHAIIGAGAVVTRTVPPYELWAGNPARHIRSLQAPSIHE